jgi:hypothetical protein
MKLVATFSFIALLTLILLTTRKPELTDVVWTTGCIDNTIENRVFKEDGTFIHTVLEYNWLFAKDCEKLDSEKVITAHYTVDKDRIRITYLKVTMTARNSYAEDMFRSGHDYGYGDDPHPWMMNKAMDITGLKLYRDVRSEYPYGFNTSTWFKLTKNTLKLGQLTLSNN